MIILKYLKKISKVGLGIIVGCTLYFNDSVVIKEKVRNNDEVVIDGHVFEGNVDSKNLPKYSSQHKSTKTTIPFIKDNEFDYASVLKFLGDNYRDWAWLIFIPMVIVIVTAVSNGANMTDGLDGLATGTSAIIGATLGVFAYVSGNTVFANYLNIMYIPNSGELVIYIGAFVGACVGFMWYNSFPAQVFMGDTGSLALGGIIAVFALAIRKELLIPILCGIFLVENLSVMMQVGYFKYQKKRKGIEFARANRLFKMAPLHHHYQKSGFHEAKIVTRFWIVGVMLAILTFVTLKLR
jgi:phospho-N-acetylmuramoyl-pentapeptide-transferase